MKTIALALTLLFAAPAVAEDVSRYGSRNVRVNLYPYGSSGIQFVDPSSPALPMRPCFPYSCGGISGPFRNPDTSARDPENLTSCIYGADGVLLYEREGKICPYQYTDSNTMRVERRRQEWLRQQAQHGEASR